MIRSTVSDNRSGGGVLFGGGGISNSGPMTIWNSTISGNETFADGGGILNYAAGEISLQGSTIASNRAASDNSQGKGGGIFNKSTGAVVLGHTLIAGNSDQGTAPDCGGADGTSVTSEGFNFIENVRGCVIGGETTGNITGQAALIEPLAENGGPTQTHALRTNVPSSLGLPRNSPAIDAGNPVISGDLSICFISDQRGVRRPVDGDGDGVTRCDIGSFELNTEPPISQPALSCNGLEVTANCTVNGAAGRPCAGTAGNDVIIGTGGADVIQALRGNDTIQSLASNDTVCGGEGNDVLAGGSGNDRLFGALGNDRFNGGRGRDTCSGGAGRDRAVACEVRSSIP